MSCNCLGFDLIKMSSRVYSHSLCVRAVVLIYSETQRKRNTFHWKLQTTPNLCGSNFNTGERQFICRQDDILQFIVLEVCYGYN